jgi:hypothetical protein
VAITRRIFAIAAVFLAGGLMAGCTRTQKDDVMQPKVTRDVPSADWQAPIQSAVDYFVDWSKAPLKRIEIAPVHVGMPYWMQVRWSEEAAGPLHRATAFALDGALVWAWTPQARGAALRQAGLPKRRPPAAQVARFLEDTRLFGDDFPGFWDAYADAPRADTEARWADGILQIDYQSVPEPRGGPGGVMAPVKRRISVTFDGQALTVTRTQR